MLPGLLRGLHSDLIFSLEPFTKGPLCVVTGSPMEPTALPPKLEGMINLDTWQQCVQQRPSLAGRGAAAAASLKALQQQVRLSTAQLAELVLRAPALLELDPNRIGDEVRARVGVLVPSS